MHEHICVPAPFSCVCARACACPRVRVSACLRVPSCMCAPVPACVRACVCVRACGGLRWGSNDSGVIPRPHRMVGSNFDPQLVQRSRPPSAGAAEWIPLGLRFGLTTEGTHQDCTRLLTLLRDTIHCHYGYIPGRVTLRQASHERAPAGPRNVSGSPRTRRSGDVLGTRPETYRGAGGMGPPGTPSSV